MWTADLSGLNLGLGNKFFYKLALGSISKRYGSFASVKRLQCVISAAA
jgi:hypothetical protein